MLCVNYISIMLERILIKQILKIIRIGECPKTQCLNTVDKNQWLFVSCGNFIILIIIESMLSAPKGAWPGHAVYPERVHSYNGK